MATWQSDLVLVAGVALGFAAFVAIVRDTAGRLDGAVMTALTDKQMILARSRAERLREAALGGLRDAAGNRVPSAARR